MSRMAYRFRMDEPVETGVRRIAGEQIDEAMAVIRAADLPIERIVHEVRRRCKALRALIRLVRPVFPDFDAENAAFRDIAHALAGSRDAKVMADTLTSFADEEAPDTERRLFARLGKRFAQPAESAVGVRQTLADCAARLLEARGRIAGWSLTVPGWEALSKGLAKTVKAARHEKAALEQADTAECSHEWRKHVKYHWHHMRLLKAAGPDAADQRIDLAERLGALLGERHDLDLFVERLAAQPRRGSDAAMLDLLAAKARKRAAKLEERAIKLGARLFDEKPRKLAARWGERWQVHVKESALT